MFVRATNGLRNVYEDGRPQVAPTVCNVHIGFVDVRLNKSITNVTPTGMQMI